jgi:hypothetical protein
VCKTHVSGITFIRYSLSQKIGKPKSFKSHWKQAKQWYYAVHVIAILIKDFKLKLFTKCSLSRNVKRMLIGRNFNIFSINLPKKLIINIFV